MCLIVLSLLSGIETIVFIIFEYAIQRVLSLLSGIETFSESSDYFSESWEFYPYLVELKPFKICSLRHSSISFILT